MGMAVSNTGAELNFRVLKGGIKVSRLAIGTWAWGDKTYWGYTTEQDASLEDCYRYCLSRGGVNFFDTAEVYGMGKSELLLSRFKRNFTDVRPMIATKFAPVPWKLNKAEAVVDACRSSMDRLGVDNIGLYQLHWPIPTQNEGYWDGLAKCYQNGWVRAVGVSNYNARQLRAAHKYLEDRGVPLATNQIQFSMVARKAEYNGLIKAANELGITTLAYAPLGQGLLTGKYTLRKVPKGPRAATVTTFVPRANPLLKSIKGVAEAKTQSLGFPVSMSQVAINWCMAKGTIPIVGARSRLQAMDNCHALKWSLTGEEVALLDTISSSAGINLPNPISIVGNTLGGIRDTVQDVMPPIRMPSLPRRKKTLEALPPTPAEVGNSGSYSNNNNNVSGPSTSGSKTNGPK